MLWMLYELPETSATARMGNRAATMQAARPPRIYPPRTARSILSASMKSRRSTPRAACSPTRRLGLQEPRRTVAAEIRNDHPRPGLRKDWRGLIIGARVVGKPVADDARPAGRGSVFQIGDGKTLVSIVLIGVDMYRSLRQSCLARTGSGAARDRPLQWLDGSPRIL